MARLPALVDAIAAHDGRGRATIVHIARKVRDAGLIQSTTRGAGAAEMTCRDAAILLTAVNGHINPQGSVDGAQAFAQLRPATPDLIWKTQREDLSEKLKWLREPLSFLDTLERLIEHAHDLARWEADYLANPGDGSAQSEAEFSMKRAVSRFDGVPGGFRPGLSRPVRVIFYLPGIAAEVHIGWVWEDLSATNAFHEYYVPPPLGAGKQASPVLDTLFPIEVGTPMLVALHDAVRARPRTRGPALRRTT